MKKFETDKILKQLKKINKDAGKDIETGIQLIINNLEIYNTLLDKFERGDFKQVYLLYQMSSTIFKQLASFNIFPDKKESENSNNDSLSELIKKVNGVEKR